MKKIISVEVINKIKSLKRRSFEFEDDSNFRGMANCDICIARYIVLVTFDKELQGELYKNINWADEDCSSKLVSLGWTVV